MVKLLTTEGEVVGGNYRCKVPETVWMGAHYTHMGMDKCPCRSREDVNSCYPEFDNVDEKGNCHYRPSRFVDSAIYRADGCIKARVLPAGFLRLNTYAIDKFMRAYPELCYGPQYSLSVDLFHHGAYEGIWWGEDYAFCRNYEAKCGEIWLIPDMNINHHGFDGTVYEGNYHQYLLSCPGGSEDPQRKEQYAEAV